jgi:hypothetical protein
LCPYKKHKKLRKGTVEANSTGGQGSRRAVAPSDDNDDDYDKKHKVDKPQIHNVTRKVNNQILMSTDRVRKPISQNYVSH